MGTLTCLCPPFCRVSVGAHKYCPIARLRWKLYAFITIRQEMALHDADLNSYRHTERKNRKTEVLTLTRMLVYAALSTNLGSNLRILKKMVEKTLGFIW
jgi:hypothetical protein